MASIFPGMGQFLLGEPKRGGTILLIGAGSTAVWFAGMSIVASNDADAQTRNRFGHTKYDRINRIGYNLMIAGTVAWITTEYIPSRMQSRRQK